MPGRSGIKTRTLNGNLRWIIRLIALSGVLNHFSLLAQVNKSDSLDIVTHIGQAHEQLSKHKYTETVTVAQAALDKSTKLDFKWGIINSHLLAAQAQKSLANYPASLNHFLQALSELQKQNDQHNITWTNTKIGELFQEWGVPEKALPYYTAALRGLGSTSTDQYSALIERMAEVHLSLNQKDQSLELYFQLLELMRKKNDLIQTKRILDKVAFIYSVSNDIPNSLKYNLQLLEVNKKLNDEVSTAATLNVIGNQYKDLKNLDRALEYYQAALVMNRKVTAQGDNDNRIVTNLINIGTIYQSRGDNRNAIKSFKEALEVKEKKGTPVEVAVMHNYLAALYLTQGNFSDAEKHTKVAIDLLRGTENNRILVNSYKRLSDIYARQGSYEKSLESYQAYSMLKDSILFREQITQEKEKLKEYVIETTEKEAKLNLIDQEMQALALRNEKEIAEREKQDIALRLKEKELQNVSLQNKQLEQAREVQHLELQQGQIEKEKQQQEIVLLEQKRDLQAAEIKTKELQEKEREKEIDFKNTRLELQQSQLERIGIRQQLLLSAAILFLFIIILTLVGYRIKQADNKKLQAQYDEINRQKEQIESINKSLVELNEEKNDLIGIVAHDLKSPLNQISGILEIIKLTAKDQPEEQKEYMTTIEQSTNRLKKMITKILDVNAIESQQLNIKLEKVNVATLLENIIGRFIVQATRKGIVIIKEFERSVPPINTDTGYFSEVMENLLSNAVKYSPANERIIVKVSKQAGNMRIEFGDHGQGISQQDMKHLFGKYRKLSARPTAGEDSTGLGLSIVKKYVQALNGKVWCDSEVGKGSNFIVELPIA
jgi:signal transduction histidine kinase